MNFNKTTKGHNLANADQSEKILTSCTTLCGLSCVREINPFSGRETVAHTLFSIIWRISIKQQKTKTDQSRKIFTSCTTTRCGLFVWEFNPNPFISVGEVAHAILRFSSFHVRTDGRKQIYIPQPNSVGEGHKSVLLEQKPQNAW